MTAVVAKECFAPAGRGAALAAAPEQQHFVFAKLQVTPGPSIHSFPYPSCHHNSTLGTPDPAACACSQTEEAAPAFPAAHDDAPAAAVALLVAAAAP